MNYKELIGKTVFDFTKDEALLKKVANYSPNDPMHGFSKEYILDSSSIVHAQMLQKLAAELKNKELLKAAKKLEEVRWKEQYEEMNRTGLVID